MTSTSSELPRQVVLRDLPAASVAPADTAVDLRDGLWTRFGTANVLGDEATEGTLRALAERSRDAARAQGFASGWADGIRAAQERAANLEQEHERVVEERSAHLLLAQHSAVSALEQAVRRAGDSARELQEELAAGAVELALRLAEAVLGREVSLGADAGADALRRALAGVPLEAAVTVRLNPADLAALDASVVADRSVTLVADPAVARGDALAETRTGVVDASIAAAMDRVRDVLTEAAVR